MVDLMLDVTDVALNRRLSEAATEHFTGRYSPEAVFTAYDLAFGR